MERGHRVYVCKGKDGRELVKIRIKDLRNQIYRILLIIPRPVGTESYPVNDWLGDETMS